MRIAFRHHPRCFLERHPVFASILAAAALSIRATCLRVLPVDQEFTVPQLPTNVEVELVSGSLSEERRAQLIAATLNVMATIVACLPAAHRTMLSSALHLCAA
eukprot:TRINITY_DN1721_c0_g1_i2.p3 TRINITY_DN1721_c0_g1~~TRINITY_DN1721_c0_g1_i2.p3  ORF type:complete len:103 (+),score=10.48 TRINITY_DN1721_c0_g1_i2:143-451(+)